MKKYLKFFTVEFILYCFQILIGFIVICLLTKLFATEEITTKILNAKITDSVLLELGWTLIAITVVLGLITLAQKVFDVESESILNEVMLEMPRAIYFFGSQMTAAIIALAIAIHFYPSESTLNQKSFIICTAILVSITTFLYGCGLKFALKRKELSQ